MGLAPTAANLKQCAPGWQSTPIVNEPLFRCGHACLRLQDCMQRRNAVFGAQLQQNVRGGRVGGQVTSGGRLTSARAVWLRAETYHECLQGCFSQLLERPWEGHSGCRSRP